MKKILLFVLSLVVTFNYVFSQEDIVIAFAAEGESTTVDSVVATNLTTNESVAFKGDESLVLMYSATRINKLVSEGSMAVYPNPFKNSAKLNFVNTKEQTIAVQLTDMAGKVMASYKKKVLPGNHMFDISAGLPGLYVVSIISNDGVQSTKIVQKEAGTARIEPGKTLRAGNNNVPGNLKGTAANVLNYAPEDIISYQIKSGNNVTVVNETPAENKTITAQIVTCKDFDNNYYRVVKLGDQIWMAEDLRVTHYPNGIAIPNVTNDAAWGNLTDDNTSDAYCFYNNLPETDKEYGAIYTYAAAIGDNWENDNFDKQGICPDGWHLPEDAEWDTLISYLGGAGVAGGKMKEGGTIHWVDNIGADNRSGFTALPGGGRMPSSGSFGSRGYNALWWSATEYPSPEPRSYAYFRFIYNTNSEIDRNDQEKSAGYSVRCVLD